MAISGSVMLQPSAVREYSTLAGTSAYTRRAIRPSRSSPRSVWVSVFFEISPTS